MRQEVARRVTKDRRRIRQADETQNHAEIQEGEAYAKVFTKILQNVSKTETVQYVLCLIDQILQEDSTNAELFHENETGDPCTTFLSLLRKEDWLVQEIAATVLTRILVCREKKDPREYLRANLHTVTSFIDWLCHELRAPSKPPRSFLVTTHALARILMFRNARPLFVEAGGIELLPKILSFKGPLNVQLAYEASLVAWLISFDKNAALEMGKAGCVTPLVEICRTARKEKVIRVSAMALRNLLILEKNPFAREMSEAGLPKAILTHQMHSVHDEELEQCLEQLDKLLSECIQTELSSFDRYRNELLTGKLQWGVLHKEERFWRAHATEFEQNNCQLLLLLKSILETSSDSVALCIACNDLGMFIMHHPHGRFILKQLRVKEAIMKLISHSDKEVQRYALMTVQKLLISKGKLDFLTQSNA